MFSLDLGIQLNQYSQRSQAHAHILLRLEQCKEFCLILQVRTRRIAKRIATRDTSHETHCGYAASPRRPMLFRRIVVQVLPEPSLDFSHAHPFAFAVVGDLIAVDLAEAEIP
jgi:hypothetical protein